MADGRMRLTILGGYLGAGKTTWLRHALHMAGGAGPWVVVNEAAAIGVDDHLLRGAAGLSVLDGGCACCAGRDGLIRLLRGLADRRSGAGQGVPDRIVLETSGLADPAAIVAALRDDPVLVHHIRLDEVVVLVDALHGMAALGADMRGRMQVASADRLIVTKIGSADPAALAVLVASLRALNPAAPTGAAEHGVAVPLPALPACLPAVFPDVAGGPLSIRAATVALGPPVDWARLGLWLSALLHRHGDDLVRVKGVVRTSAGRLMLQAVRRVVQAPEVLPPGADGTRDDVLVFIGQRVDEARLTRSWQGFGRC